MKFTNAQRGFQKGTVIGLGLSCILIINFIRHEDSSALPIALPLIVMWVASVIWVWRNPNLGYFLTATTGAWIGLGLTNLVNDTQQIVITCILMVLYIGLVVYKRIQGGRT